METDQGPSVSNSKSSLNSERKNNIVAVFVVQFDVHKGNVIEWQYPHDIDLKGIEFQAICSGLHKIEKDTVYFYRDGFYGLSVFNNLKINVERGAYMKAVGILVRPSEDTVLGDVWSHEPFLQGEISKHMNIADASGPDRYDALIEYYRNKSLNSKPNVEENEYTTPLENNRIAGEASSSVNYNLQRSVHINDKFIKSDQMPLNNLLDLAEYLGPDIFQLWKAALSRKRVMLITTPPMENACKYVYSISLLGQVTSQFQRQCTKNIKPIFAVGVNDIPCIENINDSFIACTPDSIYQMKSNLYDVGVSLPSDPVLPHLQSSRTEANVTGKFRFFSSATALEAHNSADVVRYRILWQLTCRQTRINWKKIIEKEPKDALSTVKAITTGFLYWLYENPRTNNNAIFAQPKLRWLELFAGTNHGRGNERNAGAAGETNLLLDVDDDEDATLIDNSNLLEVVTRTPQKYTTKRHNEQLIERFFVTLNTLLLTKLQSILSVNEENGLQLIPLYPKDLVQLGLDPIADAAFVSELAQLYFQKRVHVYGLNDIAHIRSCCGYNCYNCDRNGALLI